ncbi:glycoside hydrolase family 75 protein [Spirosoma sp.]|uniref:glycoside hydrolase family 75 protein n=1 Tax=Spirosoma sp. TaxID=1899569 RepID=UPI00261F0BB3|nr:glycoside hydrolase family 75 protein [Spirosoma sp.]MCX6218471.1 glycoside hydrolase family 75 protein [Spirosoma sp.]
MKRLIVFFVLGLGMTSMLSVEKTLFKIIGGKSVFDIKDKKVFLFTSGFMVDADGAPKAYHTDSKKALDFLGNAGKPGNWWALVTDTRKKTGTPIVQAQTDPAPGFFVSTTALIDPSKSVSDPKRYVNSETIPYIALPGKFSVDFKLGDIACVVNTKNKKMCFAIFADIGPADKIGEGSIFLAEQLGLNSSPKNGGTSSGITYILLKKSGQQSVLTNAQIQTIGKSMLSMTDINELSK